MHIFPTEIFEYERTLLQLNKNLNRVRCNIVLHTTLNCSDTNIDWRLSEKTKNYVIEEFKKINKNVKKIEVSSHIQEGQSEFGVNQHRIRTYQKFQTADYIIFLDSDLVFSETILSSQINTMMTINTSGWNVIIPQTLRLWDDTWDCNVNKMFLHDKINSYKDADFVEILKTFDNKQKNFFKSNIFKFAGGWFTAYSPKLLNYIGIPQSFGPYGPDDTYIMNCMNILSSKNYNISQYIIENEIVTERPLKNAWVKLTSCPDKHRKHANSNFFQELRNFSKKL